MHPVDYEEVAPSYDQRYTTNDFAGVEQCLRDFLGDAGSVAELGCGTGRWLAFAKALPHYPFIVGLDRAWGMLSRAHDLTGDSALVRGSAELLPWTQSVFDRVFCVNALHHFTDLSAVYRESARVLRPTGAFMSIGLDPHIGDDEWWIYDYFPAALEADRRRYPSTDAIRASLAAAGFVRAHTLLAQHIPARLTFDEAEAQGFLDRRSTSQLLVIDDAEWAAGLARLRRERPVLHANLRLYATIGHQS